jgi:hypothetical protein
MIGANIDSSMLLFEVFVNDDLPQFFRRDVETPSVNGIYLKMDFV